MEGDPPHLPTNDTPELFPKPLQSIKISYWSSASCQKRSGLLPMSHPVHVTDSSNNFLTAGSRNWGSESCGRIKCCRGRQHVVCIKNDSPLGTKCRRLEQNWTANAMEAMHDLHMIRIFSKVKLFSNFPDVNPQGRPHREGPTRCSLSPDPGYLWYFEFNLFLFSKTNEHKASMQMSEKGTRDPSPRTARVPRTLGHWSY